jgi:hypothetical protein
MMRVGSLPPGTAWLIRWGRFVGRGPLAHAYRRGYAATRPFDDALRRRWELVRAVERLADRIPEERSAVLREIGRLV